MRVSHLILLLKAFFSGSSFKENFSFFRSENSSKKPALAKKLGKGVVAVLLWFCILIGVASFMMMFGFTYYSIETLGIGLGKGPGLAVVFALFASTLMLFIFGFMMSIDTLYKGRDLSLLKTLPLSEAELISSRIIIMLSYLLPIHILIVLPALVITYISSPFSIATITGSIIVLFIAPVIPVSICCLVAMLTCRLGARGPGKLVVQIITFVGFILLLSLFQVGAMENFSAQMQVVDISNMGGIYAFLSENLDKALLFVPTLVWFSKTLFSGAAILNSLLSILLSVLVFSITAYLMSLSYSSITASFEAGTKARRSKTHSESPEYRQRSAVVTLAIREWEILKSSSSFLFEIGGEAVIPFLLIIVWGVMGALGEITQSIEQIKNLSFFPFIVFGVLLLFQGFGQISATSASREGKLFDINRSYPLDGSIFINAKLLVHLIATWVPNVIFTLIAIIVFRMPWWNFLWMIILSFVFSIILGYEGLAIDIGKPYLTWKNPQQAVKQNLNGIKAIGLCLGQMLILGGGFYLLYSKLSILFSIIWVVVLLGVMLFVSRNVVLKVARKVYN